MRWGEKRGKGRKSKESKKFCTKKVSKKKTSATLENKGCVPRRLTGQSFHVDVEVRQLLLDFADDGQWEKGAQERGRGVGKHWHTKKR